MDIVSEFYDWVLTFILGFFQASTDTIFTFFGDFFEKIYSYLVEYLTIGNFETIGEDFFGIIFSKSQGLSFSFNLIYWLVGLMLCIFVFRRFVIPLIVAVVDDLIDLFTPS